MPRKAVGSVVAPNGDRQRSWAIRFPAYGKRRFVTLGRPEDGWTRQKAERELNHVLADVERGIWRPDEPVVLDEPAVLPTFHEFASEWLQRVEHGLRPRTVKDYKWALELHLLPWFARHKLSEITIEEVDRYKASKLRDHASAKPGERKLGPNAINKTLTRLGQILEVAVEYGHIDKNPAKGRRRRVKATEPRRSWVEAEQLPALLDASSRFLRPLLATLAGAGLRIGEAMALTWTDVNLATGTITVRESKTAAGEGRQVDIPIGLHEELATWKARTPRRGRGDPVFLSRPRDGEAGQQTARNAQSRIKTAVKHANVELAKMGIDPINESVTPHSLRRTYASLRAALRDDPVYIAEQLGHQDARFTFRVYQRAAKRRERLTGAHLAAFDRALEWAGMGRERADEMVGEQVPGSMPNAGNGGGKLESRPVRL